MSRLPPLSLLAALALSAMALVAGCAPLEPLREAPSTLRPGERGARDDSPEVRAREAFERYRQRRDDDTEAPERYRPWIAVLPFVDESGFRDGVWDLVHEPPALLTQRMGRSSVWRLAPYAAVRHVAGDPPERWDRETLARIATELRVDLVVTSTLLDYNMERLHVGDPLIGGYKSYKGIAELEAQLHRPVAGDHLGVAHSRQESIDRGLGLDLLGKPREEDYDFLNLDRMEYGSETFQGTAIGQATIAAFDRVMEELKGLVQPQVVEFEAAEILSVYDDEVFINVGGENGVQRGYRFAVLAAGGPEDERDPSLRLAVVEVVDIIGARVSKVEVLAGADRIVVGDRLELLGGGDEDEGDDEQDGASGSRD